jgi:hypothetical protein
MKLANPLFLQKQPLHTGQRVKLVWADNDNIPNHADAKMKTEHKIIPVHYSCGAWWYWANLGLPSYGHMVTCAYTRCLFIRLMKAELQTAASLHTPIIMREDKSMGWFNEKL